ncbi:serine/threonine-protein phosphatase 6 regulatory ankyrin repeat subunit B-like [Trichogramma pretiosum]|uniref:serine/threonine-protein phosphatase 6 regulatory ankyrin repeat subunit B-like n=1 Tax=Trichogramma pretiosum TaxID=7493 RepID=UPI0006C93CEF|nr:serine/threonine-protein phosphatase 6 regulatory ankyrin repeat subunit B-like [Trichogramma pretiosum]
MDMEMDMDVAIDDDDLWSDEDMSDDEDYAPMYYHNQKIYARLPTMSVNFNWAVEDERYPFFCRLLDLTWDWDYSAVSLPPNLRDIFRAEAIDYFLTQAVLIRDDDRERAEQFIRFVSASGYKDQPTDLNQYGRPSPRRTTLVHRAIGKNWDSVVIRHLLRIYDGCDVNYVDESGLTHFHVACWKGFNDAVQRFLDHGRVDPNDCLWRDQGQSPLYLAVSGGHDKVIASLLRGGADPNSVDAAGRTALHHVCELWTRDRLASIIFELGRENNHPVLIDAQNNEGNTPLLLAVSKGNFRSLGEFLLRKGADPNLANAEGSTALHAICKGDYDQDLVNAFFELSRENNHPVLINAQDNQGNTPLHLAVSKGNKNVVEYLLRRGADSSLANAEGQTALHIICKRDKEDDLIDTFFNVCAEVNQVVQVDAEDNLSVTPLQWAVTRFRPHVVDVLLNRGADVSHFVFPEEDLFSGIGELDICSNARLLRLASGALACVELLEARGYAMNLIEALRLMKMFAFNSIYEQPRDRARFRRCHRNEEFMRRAREIMISADVSLYDAMQTHADQAEDRLNYMDYYEFALSSEWAKIPQVHRLACAVHLCEKSTRGFFRRWALFAVADSMFDLLPVLCRDTIFEMLSNYDLRAVVMAADPNQNEVDDGD